jgi:hypothetical protein
VALSQVLPRPASSQLAEIEAIKMIIGSGLNRSNA